MLIGDPTKAKEKLGWEPSVTFEELVALMVEADLKSLGIVSVNGNVAAANSEAATVRENLVGSAM